MHHKQSRKAGKRRGTRRESRTSHKSRPPAPRGHHRQRSTRRYTPAPYFKNMFRFCPFWSPKFPRKYQSTPKIHLFLTRLGIFCPDDRQGIGWRMLDVCPDMGRVEHKRGTPPLLLERQVPFTPIIFRTIKIEKSSPKRT